MGSGIGALVTIGAGNAADAVLRAPVRSGVFEKALKQHTHQ